MRPCVKAAGPAFSKERWSPSFRRIPFVFRVLDAGFRLLIYRHEAHQTHKIIHAFVSGAVAQRHQITAHLTHAQKGPLSECPVDFLHQHKVDGRFTGPFIIQAGTGYAEQSALPHNTEPAMAGIDHALPAGNAHSSPRASAKKSCSTVSWPIFWHEGYAALSPSWPLPS